MAKYKWDNLILFTEQLATAAKLGLPLDRTIASLSRETIDGQWAKAQESVSELMRLGSPLSEAMDNYPQFFPGMMRRLARIGEEGGVLATMLSCLSQYIQSAREIQHRLQKCLIYPLIIWTMLVADIGILTVFVFPKFYSFAEMTTGNMSSVDMWYLGVGPSVLLIGEGILLLLAWILIGWLSADIEGKSSASRLSERVIPYIPFLGNLHRHSNAAEICEILGLLVEGGCNIRDAIRMMKISMEHSAIHWALDEVESALAAGSDLAPCEKRSLIPPTSLWMIAQTGGKPELGQALRGIAQYHRRQVDMLSAMLRELIEPLLIFSVAVIGGMTIITFYIGLSQLTNVFQMFQ